ncbi:MAG: ArsR/SmtB family transcription factor [Granulosicoccus sp.]
MGALAHQTRLQIVRHLVKAGSDGDTAGAIGTAVDAAPSKITFHISALERAGLVSSERVSRQIVYRITFEQLGCLLKYLMEDCCENNSTVLGCCGVKNSGKRR